jgi:DNA polymerase-3 subunit gamma/tau
MAGDERSPATEPEKPKNPAKPRTRRAPGTSARGESAQRAKPVPQARPAPPAEPAESQPRVALYRRYRPATFAEVKGQDHVTEPLRAALASGRIHHAYLFSGPRGCGKTSSARILARSLNCEHGPTPDPCGRCASCTALAPNGPGSIDVIEIDAASHGGVDDARDLRERAFYAPVSGRFKVYIVDEAHMVTREGFNALLKLVEEPPPHLKFVFATTEPDKVVPTIRSRTHHYPFRLMPPAVLRQLLEEVLASEGAGYEPAVLPVVIRAAAGSARDALSILDQLLAGSPDSGLSYERAIGLLGYTDDSLLDEVVEAFAAEDGAGVFRAVNKVIEGGHDPRRFAADLLDRLRDLIILATVPDAGETGLLGAPADRLERMAAQAGKFGAAQLTRAAEVINAGLAEMRGATSPRLLLELMCAQVLLPAAVDAGLAARLERLERRMGPPAGGQPVLESRAPSRPAGAVEGSTGARPTSGPGSAGHSAGRAQDGRPRPAPESPRPPAEPAARPRLAAVTPAGTADTQLLQARWPEILDMVRRRGKKVAWILLRDARPSALNGGLLTLAFPREGNARGFAAGGHDAVLAEVLSEMFGISPRISAVADTAGQQPGAPDAGGAGPGDTSPPAGGSAGLHPEAAGDERAGELTGMDLIRAELGGEIIEENDS